MRGGWRREEKHLSFVAPQVAPHILSLSLFLSVVSIFFFYQSSTATPFCRKKELGTGKKHTHTHTHTLQVNVGSV